MKKKRARREAQDVGITPHETVGGSLDGQARTTRQSEILGKPVA
jgi:hypothetical protein